MKRRFRKRRWEWQSRREKIFPKKEGMGEYTNLSRARQSQLEFNLSLKLKLEKYDFNVAFRSKNRPHRSALESAT